MKKILLAFVRRGLTACGFGPLTLAVVYLCLHGCGALHTLTVEEVCMGIFSLSGLAFVAGGMNVIYQLERLPLMMAVLIHGAVLYICYLVTYLLNGWMQRGTAPILLFSVIFVLGYLAIWAIIYTVTQKKTRRLNELLKQQQQ